MNKIVIQDYCYYRGNKRLTNFILVRAESHLVIHYITTKTIKAPLIGPLPKKFRAFENEVLARGNFIFEPGFSQADLDEIFDLLNN